jgi:hypothetical protein
MGYRARYPDGRMPVFHGPGKLADYTAEGKEVKARGLREISASAAA